MTSVHACYSCAGIGDGTQPHTKGAAEQCAAYLQRTAMTGHESKQSTRIVKPQDANAEFAACEGTSKLLLQVDAQEYTAQEVTSTF